MQRSAGQYLFESIQNELRLPEIDADACVYSQFDQSTCQACVESCPTQAWVLGEESLGLNTDACDGCGLCIPSCPTGALSVQFPWIIRQTGGHSIALFACELSPGKIKTDVLPCIHVLGLRQLLLMYNHGIRYLLITTADCSSCKRQPSIDINRRLEQLNELLAERAKPVMKVMQRSHQLWQTLFKTDEIISPGIKFSRRHFLRGSVQKGQRQSLVQDPLNLAENQTLPPGQLLPAALTVIKKTELHWPWSVQLDNNKCNGCDACINLCPNEALLFVSGNKEGLVEYRLNPVNCNGCGICQDACETNAISINQFSKSPEKAISLTEKTCHSCGNSFHLPSNQIQSEKPLCRICQIHDHSNNLFQVL
jgi:ferredoxin